MGEVLEAFRAQLGSTRGQPGCLGCAVARDPERLDWIHFHSSWFDEACLRAYFASEVVTSLLQLLELSPEEPEILIRHGSASFDGMATLRAARLERNRRARFPLFETRREEDPNDVTQQLRPLKGDGEDDTE
jgi:quinol monooxygenase YgiN